MNRIRELGTLLVLFSCNTLKWVLKKLDEETWNNCIPQTLKLLIDLKVNIQYDITNHVNDYAIRVNKKGVVIIVPLNKE